jgi:exopolysaccharide/PEP-CTERM locus tyrosine autokinase
MSAVERALQKLRDAAGGAASQAPRHPVAQVAPAAGTPQAGSLRPERAPGKTLQFDTNKLRDAWLCSPDNQALADQYRVIKRSLLTKAAAPPGEAPLANLVAVTSALAGEGKTFMCMNLALSIATEKDWRVLVIDADGKNPQLSRLLGAEQEPGLLDVLKSDRLRTDDVTIGTSIPGLAVIPLGTRDEHAAELFASARMTGICAELSASGPHQLVIFDTSPLLLTTESAVVAGHCGQVLVVVKAGSTAQQAVLSAVHKLDPARAVGLVLNCANDHADALSYGSYGAYPYVES